MAPQQSGWAKDVKNRSSKDTRAQPWKYLFDHGESDTESDASFDETSEILNLDSTKGKVRERTPFVAA